jgi:hypothetical protein
MAEVFQYQKSLVAYIDLLGTQEALNKKKGEDLPRIWGILRALSNAKSDFKFKKYPAKADFENNGHTPFVAGTCAATSAFSDHIVISCPLTPFNDEWWLKSSPIEMLEASISRVALAALASGFLIRGAISVGDLYHEQGVIFGEALVDAYRLESKEAIYPRIIVSHQAEQLIRERKLEYLLKEDFDSLCHFHYLQGVFSNLRSSDLDFKIQIARFSAMAEWNAHSFKQEGDLHRLAKWAWFLRYLNSTLTEKPWNKLLFDEAA